MIDHILAQDMFNTRYYYRASVLSVYDGDTITVNVELGFNINFIETIRLARIDAWELRGTERAKGLEARDWLRSAIPPDSTVYIHTIKDKKGKYGRYLGDIYVFENGNFICLNDELVLEGHAVYKDY
jgi:micrococcal nuclease